MAGRFIIFVPGKNPKPRPEQHKELLWKTLLEGVRRANAGCAAELQEQQGHFKLIAWNFLYYHSYKDINREIPWIDRLLYIHGPSDVDIAESRSWHRRSDRLLYNLLDYMPWLLHFLPGKAKSTAQELQRYFSNGDDIACTIREQLKHLLRPLLAEGEKVLVIGHSLGSVIAYDTLWELGHEEGIKEKVDLFLTLGSPLGMNYVQHRLRGHEYRDAKRYPCTIRHWTNVASVGDITALDRVFANDFAPMIEYGLVDSIEEHCEGIYNFYRNEEGLNCHRSYGYLINPAVGSVIADWWCAKNGKSS